MLRITIIESSASSKTLRLEGRIAGAMVDELRRLCRDLLAAADHARLILDLSAVSFIDADGIELLRDLGACRDVAGVAIRGAADSSNPGGQGRERHVTVTNYSPFLAELLREVVSCS